MRKQFTGKNVFDEAVDRIRWLHAARLIESCGLKGFERGGARVSEKHANFIVNPKGAARASDIEALIGHVQRVVYELKGVQLSTEVRIVGEEA